MRQDKRIEDDIEIIVRHVFYPDGTMMKVEFEEKMLIKNISASGVQIVSKTKYEMESSLKFSLTLGKECIDVIAKIVRIEEQDNKYIYGCKYEYLGSDAEKAIRKYVFDKELSRRGRL